MTFNGINTENKLQSAYAEAVSAFTPPEGLKEAMWEGLSKPTQPKGKPVRILRWLVPPAAAAALAAGILLYTLLGSGATLTLADVQGATAQQPWVHVKYDVSSRVQIVEWWFSLQDGDSFAVRADGSIVFVDRAKNIRWVYSKDSGVISEDAPAIYPDGKIPLWQPKSAWELIVGPEQKPAGSKTSPFWRVERVTETVDGRTVIRFDQYHTDATGQDILIKQLWADPKTRLPLRIRRRLQLGERKGEAQWTTGTYDYPDSGPESIYALGVPKHLRPVKRDIGPRAQAIVAAGKQAVAAFPKRYRCVTWSDDRESEVKVIHRDGDNYRMDLYFNLGPENPTYHLPLPATVDEVLQWTANQRPMQTTLYSDGRSYRRLNTYPKDVNAVRREETVRVLRQTVRSFFIMNTIPPTDDQWPYANQSGPAELVARDPESPAGCILLRFGGHGNWRTDFYLDPKRDYTRVKTVRWQRRDGQWRKEREVHHYRLRRLLGGHWYATRRVMIHYGDEQRGVSPVRQSWNIDVMALGEDELPEGIFDGKPLLKGAKVHSYY